MIFFSFILYTVPPLTVRILPITENGHFGQIVEDLQPPFTQSSAKMTPSPEDGDHLIQEQHQLQPLTAGRKYELPCRAYGSRPPAKLTWWMDGRRLDTTRETVSKPCFCYKNYGLIRRRSVSCSPRMSFQTARVVYIISIILVTYVTTS